MVEFNSNYMYLYMSNHYKMYCFMTISIVVWLLLLFITVHAAAYYIWAALRKTDSSFSLCSSFRFSLFVHFRKTEKNQNKLNPKPPQKFNIYTSLNQNIQRQCVYHIFHKSYNYQINLWPQLILLICEVLVHLMRRYFC